MLIEILLVIVLVIAILIVFLILRKDRDWQYLENQLNNFQKTVEGKLDTSKTGLDSQIKEIVREVNDIKMTSKEFLSFTEQLQDLQDILKNPKQRGVLGEYFLQTLLTNALPSSAYHPTYKMQYEFKNGEKVDAVIFVKDKIVPIDSKFSLENYNRFRDAENETEKERLYKVFLGDLKLRITETAKYIRPEEGTMDFAFMFIPHEAMYYDLLSNQISTIATEETENLLQRAAEKYKVIIVSPTTLLAYLQTVIQGLHALHIEEKAEDVEKRLRELRNHFKNYEEYHNKLGKSLETVRNHYNDSSKQFKAIHKDIINITGEDMGIEPIFLDKPTYEEE